MENKTEEYLVITLDTGEVLRIPKKYLVPASADTLGPFWNTTNGK